MISLDDLLARMLVIKNRQTDPNLRIERYSDEESDHMELDNLLIEYIGNEHVSALFDSISRWYA